MRTAFFYPPLCIAVHFGKVDQGRVQVVERQGKVRVHGSPQRWRSGVVAVQMWGRCPSMSEEFWEHPALGEKDPARHRECPMGWQLESDASAWEA